MCILCILPYLCIKQHLCVLIFRSNLPQLGSYMYVLWIQKFGVLFLHLLWLCERWSHCHPSIVSTNFSNSPMLVTDPKGKFFHIKLSGSSFTIFFLISSVFHVSFHFPSFHFSLPLSSLPLSFLFPLLSVAPLSFSPLLFISPSSVFFHSSFLSVTSQCG